MQIDPSRHKARYSVTPLGLVERPRTVYNVKQVEGGGSELVQETVDIKEELFLVRFPAGHSIRVNKAELIRLGYDKKPRVVDMETGDVIQFGGDVHEELFNFEENPSRKSVRAATAG